MMKLRLEITLALVALVILCALLLLGRPNRALQDLEATRKSLRQQGFKIDLAEFNFSTSPELRSRAAMLVTTTRAGIGRRDWPRPALRADPGLMTPAATNAALVIWKLEKLKSYRGGDLWPELREALNTNRSRLDAALQAAISGPIRFEPIGAGPSALLPYLADLRNLETTFGLQTVLALHDGQKDVAWTNLLASTCLATAYTPEPIEISHMVRFGCATLAFDAAWNALQSRDWTEAQLVDLQRRWESADFWSGLPETAAYSRAGIAAALQSERQQSLGSGLTLSEALHAPRYVWPWLADSWRRLHYRHQGSYEDEKALLLHYRDREVELRHAVLCPRWSEMRQLPGVTNVAPFMSKNYSRTAAMLNMRQMTVRWQGRGRGLLAQAAEAEARRRLIVTAIALERYLTLHGSYPNALQELVPQLIASPPTDFMDGQPLRYERTEDGHFVLYSAGLDCVDDGGKMRPPRTRRMPSVEPPDFAAGPGADLVWPRPASAAEAERLRQEERKAEMEQIAHEEETQTAAQWGHMTRRQSRIETILRTQPRPMTNEPAWQGRPLKDVLRNDNSSGTNKPTFAEMLTLHQLITGSEPETVTFELPINYDVLTNLGTLQLYIDPTPDEDSDEGCNAGQMECNRATNGNCLLVWSTIYETPGKHALQAGLDLNDPAKPDEEISGPLATFVLTNLCQFSLSSAHFEHEYGVTLRGRLPELNGSYSIEIKSPAGKLLKTISGATSNRIIEVHWDLTDDYGKVCTNDSLDTVFHITLPDSGRSQTLKGP